MTACAAIGRAVDRAVAQIASAPEGHRARTAFCVALGVGALPGVEVDAAEGRLTDAAVAAGLSRREALSHVRRGLMRGEARSRLGATRPIVEAPPSWPVGQEVRALLRRTLSVTEDGDVIAFLEDRGLDPEAIAREDVARVLPQNAELPPWARGPAGPWTATTHRLIIPVYDHAGRLVSVRARRVREADDPAFPKALTPFGFGVRDSAMANLEGRWLLCGGRGEAWNGIVVIVEGEPDFLTWATAAYGEAAESWPAVFGVAAGSWTGAIADRVPDGAIVALRTDLDSAGDRYASAIAGTLRGRCDVRRRTA